MAKSKDPNEGVDPRERVQRPSVDEDYPAADPGLDASIKPGSHEQGAAKDSGGGKDGKS